MHTTSSQLMLNICDRSHISVSPPDRIVCHEEDKDKGPDNATPIHLVGGRARSLRKELEYLEDTQEVERDDVDDIAGFAEIET